VAAWAIGRRRQIDGEAAAPLDPVGHRCTRRKGTPAGSSRWLAAGPPTRGMAAAAAALPVAIPYCGAEPSQFTLPGHEKLHFRVEGRTVATADVQQNLQGPQSSKAAVSVEKRKKMSFGSSRAKGMQLPARAYCREGNGRRANASANLSG